MITVRAYRGPVTGWVRPWLQVAEIAVSAPVVIGIRTVGMVRGGWPPSAKARREYSRMVREKVEGYPGKPMHIKTVWGVGYKFEA